MEKRNSFMSSYQSINESKTLNQTKDSEDLKNWISNMSTLISSLSSSMIDWEKLNSDVLNSWGFDDFEIDDIEVDLDETISTVKSDEHNGTNLNKGNIRLKNVT